LESGAVVEKLRAWPDAFGRGIASQHKRRCS
jgi:hypothetical protein